MVVVVTLADGSVVFMSIAIVLVTIGTVELDSVVVVIILFVVGTFVVIVSTSPSTSSLSVFSEASSETCGIVVSLVYNQNRE